ncbi:MAG: RNA degradosome polyphosphate kinase [Neomegalonema sp.]|nr:RNA degradosome polyphosphate kinase [Neomegalonema sp.]
MRADFLNHPVSASHVHPDLNIDPESPERFFNRELSWLAFNWRVLEEAQNEQHPLMERVRFLSISASNLDEFFMVRLAGFRSLVMQGISRTNIDGRSPNQQLREMDADARALLAKQQELWQSLRAELKRQGVEILEAKRLTKADRTWLDSHFLSQVFPVLTPMAIDPAHPFPFLPNKGYALALQLRSKAENEVMDALIPIPAQVNRFIELPTDAELGPDIPKLRFCTLETLVELYLDRIFPGYTIEAKTSFRVVRDSDIEIEEEAEDLVAMFESALKRRRRGQVVRMQIEAGSPKKLRKRLARLLDLNDESEIIDIDGLIALNDVSQLINSDARPDLCWETYTPRMPERLRDHSGDVFAAIAEKDMLLHHPYESFDVVVRFLQQAAQDPDVVAIRQTLYRTSKESPIVAALVEAAEAGKQVTALVELKARFDEAANIALAKRLERAGAQVIYGFTNLKTHAKMSSVVRREGKELVTYSHFGTGNYHPITAKIYTDLSLFTWDRSLGRDVTRLFNYVSSYSEQQMEQIAYSPVTCKSTLIECLEIEKENAQAGKPAQVWAKMNSIFEPEVIDALYAASQAGVQIDLIVRGICGLRPGVKGLSENIRVKSVVGRFLEHSRIVCFANGEALPSSKAKVFISSADWMDRNLNRRVETMVPIKNETVRAQVLEQVMAANLMDEAQSWVLQADGSYVRATPPDPDTAFNLHHFFMEYPSLSGRGSHGTDDAPRLLPVSAEMLRAEQETNTSDVAAAE